MQSAHAAPFITPGDAGLRHHLMLLSDNGHIRSPVTTWPLPVTRLEWPADTLRTNNLAIKVSSDFVKRVRDEATQSESIGFGGANRSLGYTAFSFPNGPLRFASFDVKRRPGRLAWAINANLYRSMTDDDYKSRLDNSYASVDWGNWSISLDKMHRWWGPGWQGSLILANNIEPVTGVSLHRLSAQPFELPVLRWLGPWSFTFGGARLEGPRTVPHPWLFTARVSFRLTPKLEFAMSRAAQWGGEDRRQSWDTFFRMVAGYDNVGDNHTTTRNQPGNQLAGYDFRWVSPVSDLPYAFYAQMIGEDEANGYPNEFLGLFGWEWWGWLAERRSYRIYVEYADTRAHMDDTRPNVAYNHSIYQDGYRYFGRSIGHTLDSDGKMTTLGWLLAYPSGHWWQLGLSHIKPNVDEPVKKQWQLTLVSSLSLEKNTIRIGWQWTQDRFLENSRRDADMMIRLSWKRSF